MLVDFFVDDTHASSPLIFEGASDGDKIFSIWSNFVKLFQLDDLVSGWTLNKTWLSNFLGEFGFADKLTQMDSVVVFF